MRIRRHHGGRHHITKHKTHTKKGHGGGSGGSTSHVLTGAAIVNALNNDPTALASLANEIAGNLLSGGFAATIIAAIEAVIGSTQNTAAGRLLAGTVSTHAGALQLNGASQPTIAMVFVNGAATAAACYVPTHLRATLATGQDVFVLPINGNMDDLQIFSIRNVF